MSKVIESIPMCIDLNMGLVQISVDRMTLKQQLTPFHWVRSALRKLLSAATMILPFLTWDAAAITITVTDPFKTLVDTTPSCYYQGNNYKDCKSTTFIQETSLTGNSTEFRNSFNAWNSINGASSKWTLEDGGALPGGEFEVSLFGAVANSNAGGVDIKIYWIYSDDTGIEHPPRAARTDKSSYFWTQGLYLNFNLSRFTSGNYYRMDARDTGDYKPPLYPNQYDDRHFYDGPRGPWPGGFFTAETFLSQVDFTTRKLTIYEGVRYRFDLIAVPEPSTILLLASTLLAWLLTLRRQRQYE